MIGFPLTVDPAEEHRVCQLEYVCIAEGWRRITACGRDLDEAICGHCGMAHYCSPKASA